MTSRNRTDKKRRRRENPYYRDGNYYPHKTAWKKAVVKDKRERSNTK